MTIGHKPENGLNCPRCGGRLETWVRERLLVEFCDQCPALFLDRGELFELFRAEGYVCPPEAQIRHGFVPSGERLLTCPKCQKPTLVSGSSQGADLYHCTPCNGFLVDRELLLGSDKSERPLDTVGFSKPQPGVADALRKTLSGFLNRQTSSE
jgi:Zn-finger nucleic acid-binding protein